MERGASRLCLIGIPALLALVLLIWGIWRGLYLGPDPQVTVETDRPGIGPSTQVTARFAEPRGGLSGRVVLEIVQGDKSSVLAEQNIPGRSAFSLFGKPATSETVLEGKVGKSSHGWLREGEAVLRATAERRSGPLRSAHPVVIEKKLPVRFRPPSMEVVSRQYYVRQGGSGAVVLRAGPEAVKLGVRVGDRDFLGCPMAGRGGDRFVLFPIPWEAGDASGIKAFAEDAAGNRALRSFITMFKPHPPRRDSIELSEVFLNKVVPEIAAETPGFDTRGSLLDQYLRINGEVRRANLNRISEMVRRSEEKLLWEGPFLQMPNSQRMAGFAEIRDYRYQGRTVDRQTHLGLDLASLSKAPVPAPNAGKVAFAGFLGIYGNAVVLDHGCGLMSLMGHLSAIEVKEGEKVSKGQTVGRTGDTGLAGGDHLHLETFVGGVSVDPVEWLDGHWIKDNVTSQFIAVHP